MMRRMTVLTLCAILLAGCNVAPGSTVPGATTPYVSPSASQEPLNIADYLDLSKQVARVPGVGVLAGDPIDARNPNSAGGVNVDILVTPVGPGIIKYAIFDVTPFNAVDDAVSSAIGGKSTMRLKVTGPLDASASKTESWRNVWYNGTIAYVKIVAVELDYMDGTILSFDLSDDPVRGGLSCTNENDGRCFPNVSK